MSFIDSDGSISDPYRNFIAISRYSKWIEEKGRRESWSETVDRYIDFMKDHLVKNYNYKKNDIKFSQVKDAILNHKVMPSMRSLMTAGPALDRDHISAYNCAFIAVDSLRSFDEAMYILMNGTGVGFSVEQKHIDILPVIAEELFPTNTTIVVEDSKLGWAKSYKELIGLLVTGQIPNWDMSKVRPAGARLKTFGGRASGPEPLNDLFKFTVEQFRIAKGRRLKPIEAHDIMCKVGEVVVVGGVRRSALISLSNLDDFEMAKAKSGQWWETEGQRALANNSAVYNAKPNTAQFLREWRNLYESKSGERGIYNMDSVRKHTDKFGRRDSSKIQGTNPCLTGDSMLLTENGWISFNEAYRNGKKNNIVVDGRVSYDSSKGEEELAGNWILDKKNKYSPQTMQASEVFLTQKNADVVKIETTSGYSVRLTPDHLVMTKNGMIEAEKLNPGDKIFITRGYLPEESLGIPETLEEKEAILMGLIAGDGTFTKHKTKRDVSHIVLWGKDKWIAEEVVGWIQDIQDINELDIKPLGSKPFSNSHILNIPFKDKVEIRSTFLSAHLEKKYGFNAESKHTVPNHFIQYAASRKARFYVAALAFCDGTVNKYNKVGSCSARINKSNKKMLSDVQLILLANGINSSVYSRRPAKSTMMPDGKGGRKKYFTKENFELVVMANAYEFSQHVGFLGGYKQELAEKIFTRSRKQNTYATVKSVNPDGNEDVFCLKEDERRILCANGITMRRCGEILLRANEFCNLTEVVVDANDTEETLKEKINIATIIGTWQSSLTNFKYIRKSWKDNCEEERLLGVSLTGIFGNPLTGTVHKGLAEMLDRLRESSVESNRKEAEALNINPSVAITTVKPSGTVSQLAGVSSGIHPWYSEYYIRTVRADNKDPLTVFLKDFGIPNEPDVMKPDMTTIFSFPIKAPKNAVVTKDISAIDHLEIWKVYRTHWTEHNPSVTINVKEDEWLDVGAWVFKNFDSIGGVSFLPASEHSYKQAPYQEITQEEYKVLSSKMPKEIPWGSLPLYELEDTTTGSQELACSAGAASCDVVDLVSA